MFPKLYGYVVIFRLLETKLERPNRISPNIQWITTRS